MTGIVYTMGIDAAREDDRNPRSWQAFTDFLTSHRGLVVVDLRFQRIRQPEVNPWNGLRMDRYFHAERDYSYVLLGHLLTALHGIESESEEQFPGMHAKLAIKRLVDILHHGEDLLCFCEEEHYAGSVRERVVKLMREQLADTAHEEAASASLAHALARWQREGTAAFWRWLEHYEVDACSGIFSHEQIAQYGIPLPDRSADATRCVPDALTGRERRTNHPVDPIRWEWWQEGETVLGIKQAVVSVLGCDHFTWYRIPASDICDVPLHEGSGFYAMAHVGRVPTKRRL